MSTYGNTDIKEDCPLISSKINSISTFPFETSDIITICLAIIALAALSTSIWQAHISRKHNRLSVKPHIDNKTCHVKGKDISCSIVNHGVGPAFISSLNIKCDDKVFKIDSYEDYKKLFHHLSIDLEKVKHEVGVPTKSSSLFQGNSYYLFKFPDSNIDNLLNDKLRSSISKLTIQVNYKSIYDIEYYHECRV